MSYTDAECVDLADQELDSMTHEDMVELWQREVAHSSTCPVPSMAEVRKDLHEYLWGVYHRSALDYADDWESDR